MPPKTGIVHVRKNCGLSADSAHRHVCRIVDITQLGLLRRIPPSVFCTQSLFYDLTL
jgi:hypothetical protein